MSDTGGRRRPIPGDRFRDWARDLVIDLAGEDDREKTTVRMLAEPMGERPVVIGTGGAYPSVRFNHAVGDAAFINPFFIGAPTEASAGRAGPYPLPPSTRLPLLRAALHHFGRHRGSLATAARITRAPRVAPPATVTAPPRPWAPAMVHEAARSDAGAARRLRKWRDAHAPGASLGAVLSAAAAATVRRHLPAPAPGGPEAITMAIEEFGDVLHATTTYHANVFDPAAVAAATEALVGDPARLLDPADGQRVTAAAMPRRPAPRP